MGIFIGFLVFVFIVLICIVLTNYNKLVKLSNAVKQARSGIDVYSEQRFDLIPNLVNTVKGYAAHEENVLKQITELRTQYMNTKDIATEAELNNKINNILLIAENYPDLKASSNFLNLQQTLTKIENELQAARRVYNIEVTTYNTQIHSIPTNIIAGMFGFKEERLFELQDPSAKENVKVDL